MSVKLVNKRILDEKGFVRENEFLVVSFPMFQGILAYRILARVNKGFETINYGVLPIPAAAPTGVVAAGASSGRFGFPWAVLPAERRVDMWWFDHRDKLIQLRMRISPFLLRNFLYLAVGTQEAQFMSIATADETVPSDFGYWRGTLELPVLPFMHFEMSSFNYTNMNLIGDVRFEYGEYTVELIRDPRLLFDLMNRRELAHWMTFPGEVKIPTDPFSRGYNIAQPIPLSKDPAEVTRSVAQFMEVPRR